MSAETESLNTSPDVERDRVNETLARYDRENTVARAAAPYLQAWMSTTPQASEESLAACRRFVRFVSESGENYEQVQGALARILAIDLAAVRLEFGGKIECLTALLLEVQHDLRAIAERPSAEAILARAVLRKIAAATAGGAR